MNTLRGKLFLGLPMWANAEWRGSLYGQHANMSDSLADYAGVFSAVEGNTTFYSGPPKEETIASWLTMVPPGFRFCFKLPSRLTHEKRLANIDNEFDVFIERILPLEKYLGPVMVQLPRDFGITELDKLEALLARWPNNIPCAVEARALELFSKDAVEKNFNRLLITYGANRVMLDVRPLFATPHNNDKALIHAQKEKPQLPLHVISTGLSPIIRFIGHTDMLINMEYFTPWINKLILWISQGKTPCLFVHTADNRSAPELARRCLQRISTALGTPEEWANTRPFPGECQSALF